MKVQLTSIIFFIFLSLSISQTTVKKIVSFKDKKIQEVKSTKNYVIVNTYSKSKPFNKVILYDKKGNELLKKSSQLGYILQAEVTETLNYLIIINMGWHPTTGYEGSNDIIQAFDIYTGQKIWQTTANASQYEMSPDGKYLLTKIPAIDRASPFGIINLTNGHLETPEIPGLQGYNAAWIDNERIVIAHRITKRNEPSTKEVELNQKLADLHHELGRIRIMLKKGELSIEKFQHKTDSIKNIIETTQEEYIKIRKARGAKIWLSEGTRILIYNHISNQILIDRKINKINGKIFRIFSASLLKPCVHVENKNFIYVYGNLKTNGDLLLKFDDNLELIWFSGLGISTSYTLTKIVLEDSLLFAIKNVRNDNIGIIFFLVEIL